MIADIIKRKIFLGTMLLCFGYITASGQTSIAKHSVEGEDVILDFKEDDNRAIILPWVTSQDDVASVVGGTLIFDSSDKKVKYFKSGVNSDWVDLSINSGDVDVSIQSGLAENALKTVIGSNSSDAPGVVVLESNNKAMVLPKMDSPHLNINSPAPGTIAYDKVSKMLCVFNGEEWSFWKVSE